MELAARAAKANYDLIIGYGGDGTLNQVLNGVMTTKDHSRIIQELQAGAVIVAAGKKSKYGVIRTSHIVI
jgi:diacylglycerol kinase family enzyme